MTHNDADARDAGFSRKVRSAVFWRSGSQILAQIISWASTLIVIRLLDPSDYGLFAMTQAILSFMQFLNGYGLVSALVQSESLDTHRLRQAFGIMLLLNGSLAALQLGIAPMAADYYDQPLVADMLRVQALIYLATPFISIPEILMGRSLDFRRPAIVSLVASAAAAAVALWGALSGWGVWTLVWAPITLFWVRGLGYAIATRFLPIPSFDFRGTGGMVAFGAAMLGSQILWLVQTQSDIVIGGRILSPHELGLYAEALFLTQIIVSKFIPPLNDVAFPAYARMQADTSAIRWSFLRALRLIMLVACPLYLGMAASAEPLVLSLFGEKWRAMTPFVELLALAMPFMTIQVMFPPVCNALGRPGLTTLISATGALIMPFAFLIGIRFGAIGLAWAWLAAYPLFTLATVRIAGRPIGLRVVDLVQAVAPGIGCSIAMALLVMLCDRSLPDGMLPPVRLAVLVSAGGASFLLLLLLFARGTVKDLVGLVIRRQAPA
ncbi:MAG: lipopolysaccharide biosynthesis protein [Sphingobium sp.]|jgi:O-antigen/teichoic acid export membrane protein|nr:lipopolysaccharide biosynthesis protein [Sphingobium sp.]MCI1270575.1 lipopolysaccharide biosynthesis protein [Sphingobium sp.]MCI2053188.1 lipopolysaccharide biosynthesis protein [Sphingobium sp.]